MKKALLINDTSLVFHYWCQIVIENIIKWLKENNINITKKIYFKENNIFEEIKWHLKYNKIDLIVINWEWSIHHNRKLAIELLSIWKKVKKIYPKMKIILINSTIEEMWTNLNLLKYFDLVNVREIKSYNYLKENWFISILTPDLSIYREKIKSENKTKQILVWWSVINKKMKNNISYSNKNKLFFRDILYIPKWTNKNPINVIKKLYFLIIRKINYLFNTSFLIKSTNKELINMSHYSAIISWRFHDIYLSILSWVDFYLLKSNSCKIESTLDFIWLKNKIFDDINEINIKNIIFTKEEKKIVNEFYNNWIKNIKNLFIKISEL